MDRYALASLQMSGSAPKNRGRNGAAICTRAVKATPNTAIANTACRTTRLALSWSPEPMLRPTSTEKPMPSAAQIPFISHVVDAFKPTAAVAFAPNEPTMAVSTY